VASSPLAVCWSRRCRSRGNWRGPNWGRSEPVEDRGNRKRIDLADQQRHEREIAEAALRTGCRSVACLQ